LKPIAVQKMVSALEGAAVFTAELQKAAAKVEQIICANIQKYVVAGANTGVTCDSPLVPILLGN
jgi:hypothetical protein